MLLSQTSMSVGSAASSFRGFRNGFVLSRSRNMKRAMEVRTSQRKGFLKTTCSKVEAPVSDSKKEKLHGSTVHTTAPAGEQLVYKGTAKIMQKLSFLDAIDRLADLQDDFSELFGKRVRIQLVSTEIDPSTGEAFMSEESEIQNWFNIETLAAQNREYKIKFAVPKNFGVPGAIIVKNEHPNEFLLVSFKLDIPDEKEADKYNTHSYITHSWVYNTGTEGRIFFLNQGYLPNAMSAFRAGLRGERHTSRHTPNATLERFRKKELANLRGDGTGERKPSDRIYDYDIYNDLGNPDKGKDWERPALGGNAELQYPRRMRTGRPPTKTDPLAESKSKGKDEFYIPRDECFNRIKNSGFSATGLLSGLRGFLSKINVWGKEEFSTEEEIKKLFVRGQESAGINNILPDCENVKNEEQQPLVFLDVLVKGQLDKSTTYPMPRVLKDGENAWRKNDEFARQFLAGLNPVVIKLVEEFPIKSSLKKFNYPVSAITAEHIEDKLDGLSVEEAVKNKKLFVADYHDSFLPYLEHINKRDKAKSYATRALFFLTKEQTLKVLALELALPNPDGSLNARVFLPPRKKTFKPDYLWEMAKAHVSNNDIAAHQVFSHFTKCHAVTEAAIIASNRCLSKMHPIMQLMAPHFKSTVEINRKARKILINAGGQIETHFTPGAYALRMGAADYTAHWTFESQALPKDLVARGMAEEDPSSKHGVKLLIEDYPYAADGLELWTAIKEWNEEYVKIFYKDDSVVQEDTELQEWFTELREKGHEGKKDAEGWPKLNSRKSLVEILTTMQWIPSCQHAAVNFGQYDYAGYMPHHPTIMRRLIPEEGDPELEELKNNPKKAEEIYLSSLANVDSTTTAMSVYEVLSAHSPDEDYLGTCSHHYSKEAEPAFEKFKEKLKKLDELIEERNGDEALKNRFGVVEMPYELLLTQSESGVTCRGVPNSITI